MRSMLAVLLLSGSVLAQDNPGTPSASRPGVSSETARGPAIAGWLLPGDPAPSLAIEHWIKGTPIASFEPGMVYVVEFWATWCGPCIQAMPHLSTIQSQHADTVRVIGVAAMERVDPLERVTDFVATNDRMIGYTIALDTDQSTTLAYMAAARRDQIPASFIVDGTGRIAWIGHPSDGLHEVLKRVLDGTWDIEAQAAAARRRAEVEQRAIPIMQALGAARKAGDTDRELELFEELLELDSAMYANVGVYLFNTLSARLHRYDEAYAFATRAIDTHLRDQPQMLEAISRMIMNDSAIQQRDPQVALAAIERAHELTGDNDPSILEVHAQALFETGDIGRAISQLRLSIERSLDGPNKDARIQTLATYEAALEP